MSGETIRFWEGRLKPLRWLTSAAPTSAAPGTMAVAHWTSCPSQPRGMSVPEGHKGSKDSPRRGAIVTAVYVPCGSSGGLPEGSAMPQKSFLGRSLGKEVSQMDGGQDKLLWQVNSACSGAPLP